VYHGAPRQGGTLGGFAGPPRGLAPAENVDLERLAQVTYGYVGGDLHALWREAAMARLRKILPNIDFGLDQVPYEELENLSVQMEDFQDALTLGEPSAIREVFTEVPNLRWSDVGGLETAKRILKESNQWPRLYPELFQRAGVAPPR